MIGALLCRLKYSAEELEYLKRKNAPELEDWVEPERKSYWQAYKYLRTTSVGPISFAEIATYSDWAGLICPVDRRLFADAMLAMAAADAGSSISEE